MRSIALNAALFFGHTALCCTLSSFGYVPLQMDAKMYVLSEGVWLTVGLESGRMLTGTYVGVLRRVHLMTSGCGLYRGGEESRKDLRVMQLESLCSWKA